VLRVCEVLGVARDLVRVRVRVRVRV
jgi:hypothetical protein